VFGAAVAAALETYIRATVARIAEHATPPLLRCIEQRTMNADCPPLLTQSGRGAKK
jgi:hypothetical protein